MSDMKREDTAPLLGSDAPAMKNLPPVSGAAALGEQRALWVCALLATATIVRISMPVGVGLLLGALAAFTLQPLYQILTRRLSPMLAALVCVLVAMLGVVGAVGFMAYLIIDHGVTVAQWLLHASAPGGALRGYMGRYSNVLAWLHLNPDQLVTRLTSAASDITTRTARVAAEVAGVTFDGLLGLFFMSMTLHFVLCNWTTLARRAELLLPLAPAHTRALFAQFSEVGRTVLLGTVLTGLAQGLLAGIGYRVTGVPEPLFFGAATALASLVPAVGTLLIWVPAGVYLLLTGHVAAGVVELCFGLVLVVGVSDYVIRPMLVGRGGEGPALLTFVALFGGIEVFGLIGLVLGPLLMTLSLAMLRLYEVDRANRRGLPSTDRGAASDRGERVSNYISQRLAALRRG